MIKYAKAQEEKCSLGTGCLYDPQLQQSGFKFPNEMSILLYLHQTKLMNGLLTNYQKAGMTELIDLGYFIRISHPSP